MSEELYCTLIGWIAHLAFAFSILWGIVGTSRVPRAIINSLLWCRTRSLEKVANKSNDFLK
jgi:hypothetical protein